MNHVALVASELVKLGFSDQDADHLARVKYRADADRVRYEAADPGRVAEEIVERETAPTVGVGPVGSADGAEELAAVARANSEQLERVPAGVVPIDETATEVDLEVAEVKSDGPA